MKPGSLKFSIRNEIEQWRAETWRTKEPGTVKWLEKLQPGETFFDVGANIGIYTLVAAKAVGPKGLVYAFEPHVPTAAALIENVAVNGVAGWVKVVTAALGSKNGCEAFHYRSVESGSSGSQVGHTECEFGPDFSPQVTELKRVIRADEFAVGPHMAKVDVDGNELSVLQGMSCFFLSTVLRSVQIEIHYKTKGPIADFMGTYGFVEVDKHFTSLGREAIESGMSEEKVTYNAVFERRK